MFESLPAAPADAILGLIVEHNKDTRENKIDLGVGVYKTPDGNTPVLTSVKKAEKLLLDSQTSKAYIGSAGAADFNQAMLKLTYGADVDQSRFASLQTPGGSGSLRIAAALILEADHRKTVWVTEPTWANHVPLLGKAGVILKPFPYYDAARCALDESAMLEALAEVPRGDIVLLHACCHNPSGVDPTREQWQAIADIIVERELIPLVDMAYQGFGDGLEDDAFIIRHLKERVPEMIVCNSCSKNFGLYRDRVGAISIMLENKDQVLAIQSQANTIVRTLYSMPPDHGAAVVSLILNSQTLTAEWHAEVDAMRARISGMRMLLHDTLLTAAPGHDFSHLARAKGMFCFLGISALQVEQLKKDHGVYMVNSSRINVAGITESNVDHLAASIAAVL